MSIRGPFVLVLLFFLLCQVDFFCCSRFLLENTRLEFLHGLMVLRVASGNIYIFRDQLILRRQFFQWDPSEVSSVELARSNPDFNALRHLFPKRTFFYLRCHHIGRSNIPWSITSKQLLDCYTIYISPVNIHLPNDTGAWKKKYHIMKGESGSHSCMALRVFPSKNIGYYVSLHDCEKVYPIRPDFVGHRWDFVTLMTYPRSLVWIVFFLIHFSIKIRIVTIKKYFSSVLFLNWAGEY